MFSKILNCNISAEAGASIDIEDAQDVANEVGHNLIKVNSKLKILGSRAQSQGRESTQKEWEYLTNIRADFAALHQTLLKRISSNKRTEKNLRVQQEQENKTFADYFKDVVRSEANRVDYQRWILQAEIRYNANQSQLTSAI